MRSACTSPLPARRPLPERRDEPIDRTRPFAVVDIGSNSLRLVVYERLARAPLVLFNEKEVCALARGLQASGQLDPQAVDAALHALHRFGRIAEAMECSRIEAVATEAARRASNGSAFLKRAREALGHPIEVLSGAEEARAAAMGVAHSFWNADGICGDLGGGSVDLAAIGQEGVGEPYASLPLGTLIVQATASDDRDAAARLVDDALATVPWLSGAALGRTFYVVGGGWRALARVQLTRTKAPLNLVHGFSMDAETAAALGDEIAAMPPKALASLAGMPRRRVDTVAAAALVFERVVRTLAPERVVFSACGLREGRLFAHLDADELAADPLLAGAVEFGAARSRSPGIGEAMAAWTEPLFLGENVNQRRLRLAVCALADTGWREHPGSRAREAFLRLAQYPFIGIDHAARAFIGQAIFTRYEGDPEDEDIRPLVRLMREPERRRSEALGAALQLGFRVSGGVPSLLADSRLERRQGELVLRLFDPVTAPPEDSVRARLDTLAQRLGLRRAVLTTEAR